MMKYKNRIIPLIIFAAIVVTGIYLFILNNKTPSTLPQTQNEAMKEESRTSLTRLMGELDNVRCEFSDQDSNTRGTVYLGGGRMRGDFEQKDQAGVKFSHLATDGQNAYIWMDDLQTGIKIAISELTTANETGFGNGQKTVDVEKEVAYTCDTWVPDETVFALPENLQFTDLGFSENILPSGYSDIQQEFPADSVDQVSQEACDACLQAPSGMVENCREALGCNR